jgi:hypothetical protein
MGFGWHRSSVDDDFLATRSPDQPVETPASDLDRLREACLGGALSRGRVSIRVCIGDQLMFTPPTEPYRHVTGFVSVQKVVDPTGAQVRGGRHLPNG